MLIFCHLIIWFRINCNSSRNYFHLFLLWVKNIMFWDFRTNVRDFVTHFGTLFKVQFQCFSGNIIFLCFVSWDSSQNWILNIEVEQVTKLRSVQMRATIIGHLLDTLLNSIFHLRLTGIRLTFFWTGVAWFKVLI